MDDRPGLDFIRQIVADDVAARKHGGRVLTRFPPEPNGFLHIGHASAICLDFGVAAEYGGRTTLRMDDTNPTTEDPAYVEAIARDIRWLGFEWEGDIRYASDYFEALYRLAIRMIEDGFAYVDSLSEEEIREYRRTVTEPSRPSPYRDRSVEENLDLFRRMRAGEFEDGSHVLRAKIDLTAANMKMRDPLMYRIRHAHHYRTGDAWPIYPMYDWAHGQSDAIEGITHSLCTLEFQDNRELYDWFLDHTRPAAAGIGEIAGAEGGGDEELGSWSPRPRQYEFARRNLDYTVVSKRKLLTLVEDGRVSGWDDPRMPTLAGLRRRGVPPEAIRAFCDQIGIGKAENRVSLETLEWAIRDALNRRAPRVLCVVRPLRVVIENFPEGEVDWLEAEYFPHDIEQPPSEWPASRRVPFTRELYIERDDFEESPPHGFKRLAPGREIRLRHAYFITCRDVVKDAGGKAVELRCTYDPATRGGSAPDGRRVKGTIHWVSATESVPAEVRLYDRLFRHPDPEAVGNFLDSLNPGSLEVVEGARIEPGVMEHPEDAYYQFERLGYFTRDRPTRAVSGVTAASGGAASGGGPSRVEGGDESERTASDAGGSGARHLVFNRTVELRDSWNKTTGARAAEAKRAPREQKTVVGADSGAAERARARAASPRLRQAFGSFRDALGLPEDLADLLSASEGSVSFFESALREDVEPTHIANWLVHDVRGLTADGEESRLTGQALGALVAMVEKREISRAAAKDVLARLISEGGDPAEIVARDGLARISDQDAIQEVVEHVLATHPDEVARFRDGQKGLAGFFVGQVMKATDNRADPKLVSALVKESLG